METMAVRSGRRRLRVRQFHYLPLVIVLLVVCRLRRQTDERQVCAVDAFIIAADGPASPPPTNTLRRGVSLRPRPRAHPPASSCSSSSTPTTTTLSLTPLPQGLSPFEKSLAKGLDLQGSFRKLAAPAIERAIRDGTVKQMEIEFPPFVGGDQSKTVYDDYDNLQELDANRDWCAQFAPMLVPPKRVTWLVLPDDKECELAKKEWTGQRYQQSVQYTSIRAAVAAATGSEDAAAKPWGSTLASTVNKLTGGDGILADASALDELSLDRDRFHLVCQPGSGGPVEDYINVEKLHKADPDQVTCVVNGALDKVRDGYYPALFFPALATTAPFYRDFTGVFVLKPLQDKGVYGFLFRVYPEPWQVILQTAKPKQQGKQQIMVVENTVALVSEGRPSYTQAIQVLLETAAAQPQQQQATR